MKEKPITTLPGVPTLVASVALFVLSLVCFAQKNDSLVVPGLALSLAFVLGITGLFVVEPNGSKVLLLFGRYLGTVRKEGFHWATPFATKRALSLRARTLNGDRLKVNDAVGNPIEIAAIVVWQVCDTYRSSFDVQNYEEYVRLQSETSLRHSASTYPYDSDSETPSLMHNGEEVAAHILAELRQSLAVAGVEVVDARLSHLAYAPEIAGAMLRRQQAAAVISARQKIVDGAVGMVEMALRRIEAEKFVELDEERKAAMVSNLLVVLCSDHGASPVVNTGSLY